MNNLKTARIFLHSVTIVAESCGIVIGQCGMNFIFDVFSKENS